jgi:hypothetical protein
MQVLVLARRTPQHQPVVVLCFVQMEAAAAAGDGAETMARKFQLFSHPLPAVQSPLNMGMTHTDA